MHVDRRFLNWGVFFIILGAVPLAVQANLISADTVARAWQLWPLLIVAAGVGLVLRRTRFDFVGGLLAAATFGLIAGGLIAGGLEASSIGISCGGNADRPIASQQGSFGGRATVDVEFGCGELAIGTAGGDGWTLSGFSGNGSGPQIESGGNDLTLRGNNSAGGWFGVGTRQNWNLVLPQNPTLDADIQVNAATGTFALAGAHLGRMQVQGNASSLTIDVGTATIEELDLQFNAGSARVNLPNLSLNGEFQVNAGSISFCVPEGVGLRIKSSDNITSGNNFADAGLTKTGDTWQSANYNSATNRIDLTANANAGGFTLNPRDGCQ